MDSLALLPVFFDVAGKRVVVAGGSHAALWKAELLQAAGAKLDVYAASPCAALQELARRRPSVRLVARAFQAPDFEGAALAVADLESLEEADRFRAAAKAAGAPVNIVDKPDFSDFQFGAIVDRSPLVVAISTAGAAPILAQAVRGRIEALLPPAVKLWASAAKAWRERLKALAQAPPLRRRFWEKFAAEALSAKRPPDNELIASLLDEEGPEPKACQGSVALVGAGPGDPELLTLKALRALQSADVILYDDLVSPAILEMARREAEKIAVGKRGYRPSCKQDQIVGLMVRLAGEGKRVVRLKGGDPMIFGRGAEEIAPLREAGIAIEVVPGVTAALGAAASLQVSLTQRGKARRLQFITAHAHDGKLPDDIDWRALSDPRASTAVYMGARTLPALVERLLAHGLESATPAILVERATCEDERRIEATIATLPAKAAAATPPGRPLGPCLILIGAVFASPLGGVRPTPGAEAAEEAAKEASKAQ